MVLARCDGCQTRPQAKYNDAYLAWNKLDGGRYARRLRLCDACFEERIASYIVPVDPIERLHCPSCHIDTDADYDAVYGTVYPVGMSKETLEIPFCTACAMLFREWAGQRGSPLEDRRGAEDGPTTHPSGSEVLRAMGIDPRVR